MDSRSAASVLGVMCCLCSHGLSMKWVSVASTSTVCSIELKSPIGFKWHLFLLVEQHSAFHRSLYLAHGPSKPWELRSAIRSFAVGPQIMSSLLCTSACDFCSSADSVIRVILEHRLTLSLGAFCNHRSLHLSKRSCMFCQQSVKSKESITLFIFSCDSCIPIQVFCPLRQELWVCGLS